MPGRLLWMGSQDAVQVATVIGARGLRSRQANGMLECFASLGTERHAFQDQPMALK